MQALTSVSRTKGMEGVAERAGIAPEQFHALLGADSRPAFRNLLRVIDAPGIRLHAEKAAR